MAKVYVVMGVSGCGKTTIGELIARELDLPFYDADDFHPQGNIDKMAAGIGLSDEDRWPWLDVLAIEIEKWSAGSGAVIACSALKEVYRKRLFSNSAFAKAKENFIYLHVGFDAIRKRLELRENHFFDPELLASQFETLEAPTYGVRLDATISKQMIITRILQIIH